VTARAGDPVGLGGGSESERLATLLDFAVEVATRAGAATLPWFRGGAEVETKADGSPVTAADRAAERLVREAIAARFPADDLLGEELGELRAAVPGGAAAAGRARRCWVVDPIDGTRSFVRGVPLFGVLLALVEEGAPVLGVIHLPALGETVAAARGEGCWHDGSRARVSAVDRLDAALVLASDAEGIERRRGASGWDRLREAAGLVRTWGDCYGYAMVATGRAEAMLDPVMAPWDVAPLAPIVEEAGGVFTGWNGERGYPTDSAVATNAALADEVRALLRSPGEAR
jgi:histidinol phosphatase-like enzyme (inositol monophosphatase family)